MEVEVEVGLSTDDGDEYLFSKSTLSYDTDTTQNCSPF